MLDKQGYMGRRECPRPCARTQAPIRTRTLARAHRSNIYCFSTAILIRERASIVRYTYTASRFYFIKIEAYTHTHTRTEMYMYVCICVRVYIYI